MNKKTPETKSGESSLSQSFKDNLDSEFDFLAEHIQKIFKNDFDENHPRIKQLNETLMKKMDGVFTKI